MSSDRKTIGVTAAAQAVLERLVALGSFRDQLDAGRFALSIAVAAEETPSGTADVTTKWNIGSFDPSGEIRSVIQALYPGTSEPYRAAEQLIDAGLRILSKHLDLHAHLELDVLLPNLSEAPEMA